VHDEAWGRALVQDEHDAFDRRHGDRHLVVSPLYHSGPFRFAAITALTGGDVTVLPRFDVDAWIRALREVRPTSLFCVPTHLHRLLRHPGLRRDDLASLQLLAHAGAPCPRPLKERVLELAPEGSVWEFYGSTEGQFTVCPPEVWQAAPGTVGVPRPGHRIEVRDDDGVPVAPGTVGTVWTRVPAHARWTYWDDPERTAAAWDGDAFTVGDLGHTDAEGRLFLDGRPGDLVISGGVNVYPAEVERRLLAHPGVAEAVVFGVPDADWGERVEAAVVLHPGHRVRPHELVREVRRELAPAKVPKTVHVVGELPRTATGKIRRVGLAQALAVGA
jgi:long-chain acyl-CoA synthetase